MLRGYPRAPCCSRVHPASLGHPIESHLSSPAAIFCRMPGEDQSLVGVTAEPPTQPCLPWGTQQGVRVPPLPPWLFWAGHVLPVGAVIPGMRRRQRRLFQGCGAAFSAGTLPLRVGMPGFADRKSVV